MGIRKLSLEHPCPWCQANMAVYSWVGGFYIAVDHSSRHGYNCPLRMNDNYYGGHDKDHVSKSYRTIEDAIKAWDGPLNDFFNMLK